MIFKCGTGQKYPHSLFMQYKSLTMWMVAPKEYTWHQTMYFWRVDLKQNINVYCFSKFS